MNDWTLLQIAVGVAIIGFVLIAITLAFNVTKLGVAFGIAAKQGDNSRIKDMTKRLIIFVGVIAAVFLLMSLIDRVV
jgi:hypothetical protein